MANRAIEYQIRVDCSKGAQGVRILTLDEGQSIVIGRMTSPTDLSTATALKFDSKVISRKHATFTIVDKKLCVKDTKSSSGTFLNGQRLSSQGEESDFIELMTGDEVAMGEDCDVDGVVYQCVFLKLTLARFEGEIKKGAVAEPSTVKTVNREDFIKIVKQAQATEAAASVPAPAAVVASPSSPERREIVPLKTEVQGPRFDQGQLAKWVQIKSRLEKGLTQQHSQLGGGLEGGNDSDDIVSALKGSGIVGESDELSPSSVEELTADFDQIWANVTHGLDGRICRYLKLAEPYTQVMKEAGVIPEPPAFLAKKFVFGGGARKGKLDSKSNKSFMDNSASSHSLANSDMLSEK